MSPSDIQALLLLLVAESAEDSDRNNTLGAIKELSKIVIPQSTGADASLGSIIDVALERAKDS